jgi:hypothetical protein
MLVAILAIASQAASAAGIDERCAVPDGFIESQSLLPNAAVAIKRTHRLDVLVLSSVPTQISAGGKLRKYPSFFEAALRERLKDTEVNVVARAEARRTVMEMLPVLPRILDELKPALVIWQSGTVEAMRGIDPDGYGRKLQSGVAAIQAAGADVVLVNMQFSPRTNFLLDVTSYTENMRWAAQLRDVPFFNRYELMRHWSENDIFDLAALKDNGTFEQVHRCIGQVIADLVARTTVLDRNANAGHSQ